METVVVAQMSDLSTRKAEAEVLKQFQCQPELQCETLFHKHTPKPPTNMESLFYYSRALAVNKSISGGNRWGTPQRTQGWEERQAGTVCKPKPVSLPHVPRSSQLSQPYWMAFFTLERQLMKPWTSHLH